MILLIYLLYEYAIFLFLELKKLLPGHTLPGKEC